MIDVVFLLLVFFMLAARFGQEVSVPLATTGQSTPYEGPPRLVVISKSTVELNGVVTPLTGLGPALADLMQKPSDVVFLQPSTAATTQRLVDVMDALRAAGLSNIAVVPSP